MIIPQALLDAKAAVEAHFQRQAAIRQKATAMGADGAQARARIADLDREIETLKAAVLEDTALAAVADAERMSAKARTAAETRIAALAAEREKADGATKQGAAVATALARIFAEREAEVMEPATVFLREWSAFERAISTEYRADIARLAPTELLTKWFAVTVGLGHAGAFERLKELKIPGIIDDTAVLVQGQHPDPHTGEMIDLKSAWRQDEALVELNASLVAIAAMRRRVAGILQNAASNRLAAEELGRLDENQRQARLAARPKGFTSTSAIPPVPVDAHAATALEGPGPQFSIGYNGTNLGGPRAGYGGRAP